MWHVGGVGWLLGTLVEGRYIGGETGVGILNTRNDSSMNNTVKHGVSFQMMKIKT